MTRENTELAGAVERLVAACEKDFMNAVTEDDYPGRCDDTESVSTGETGDSALTFGCIRDARKALSAAPLHEGEGEPVAWRWQWPGQNTWGYADYNLHPDAETVEPLYTGPSSVEVERLRERVEFLEDSLLVIAEKDRHYRSPPKPKPDGGMRGWAGHRAVWALTGQNGSYVGDAEVKASVMAARAALSRKQEPGAPGGEE